MAPSERVVFPLRIGKDTDLHMPGITNQECLVWEGESPLEAAQRVADRFAGLPATHVLREEGLPDNLRASYPDNPRVLVRRERAVMGRALKLGKHSLWKTIHTVPVDARNTF